MSPWSARITTNRDIWQFVGHVLRMRSTFKSDGQKWQTSRQANRRSLPWDRPNPNWTRKEDGTVAWIWTQPVERGQFNRLIYLWKPNALGLPLAPLVPGPHLHPHNGLCGRHEIEIAKKSQFYRHARVTWPFEWMWTDTGRRSMELKFQTSILQSICRANIWVIPCSSWLHTPHSDPPPPRHKSFDLARRSPFCISTS